MQAKHLIPDYVSCLCEEIEIAGEIAKRFQLRLETIYFGGGTPTSLEPEDVKTLLEAVRRSFDLRTVREYTVEAGRPDTITAEKLNVLRQYGVSRVSINPQSLNDRVLQEAGRPHTAADTFRVYETARKMGCFQINMDVIAGLPLDTLSRFEDTMKRIIEWEPANITVHTLTVKRSSFLTENGIPRFNSGNVLHMVQMAQEMLETAGYRPYYLYRQKGSPANAENVGWSRADTKGYYNIYMMDETHTVLGCGAGSVTKIVTPGGGKIERIYNYKYPYEYISRFHETRVRKLEAVKRCAAGYPCRG